MHSFHWCRTSRELHSTILISGRIDIKDIVWPGKALKPPEGIPEKRFIRVSFLEEDPYIMLGPASACSSNKGVFCYLKHDDQIIGVNMTEEIKNDDSEIVRCCSGFCVDLLLKFSSDLSFDFQLTRWVSYRDCSSDALQ